MELPSEWCWWGSQCLSRHRRGWGNWSWSGSRSTAFLHPLCQAQDQLQKKLIVRDDGATGLIDHSLGNGSCSGQAHLGHTNARGSGRTGTWLRDPLKQVRLDDGRIKRRPEDPRQPAAERIVEYGSLLHYDHVAFG